MRRAGQFKRPTLCGTAGAAGDRRCVLVVSGRPAWHCGTANHWMSRPCWWPGRIPDGRDGGKLFPIGPIRPATEVAVRAASIGDHFDCHAVNFNHQVPAAQPMWMRMARRLLRNPAWAEDAGSATVLAAPERLASFASRSPLRTWLVGILRHEAFDQTGCHTPAQQWAVADDEPPATLHAAQWPGRCRSRRPAGGNLRSPVRRRWWWSSCPAATSPRTARRP